MCLGAVTEPMQPKTFMPVEVEATPNTAQHAHALSAAAKVFNLYDAGKLCESALLIALGVSHEGYHPNEDLRLRALATF